MSAVGHAHIPASLVIKDTHCSLCHWTAFRKAARWPNVASGDWGIFLGEVMPVLVFRAWGYLGKRDAEAEEVWGCEGGVGPWWRGRLK